MTRSVTSHEGERPNGTSISAPFDLVSTTNIE